MSKTKQRTWTRRRSTPQPYPARYRRYKNPKEIGVKSGADFYLTKRNSVRPDLVKSRDKLSGRAKDISAVTF